MGTTARNGLPYPELGDAPDGPGALKKLADAIDPLLYRAIVCTSSTKPSSPLSGMLIYETDTGLYQVYAGGWVIVGHSAAAFSLEHRSFATAAQTVANGGNVNMAFGNDAVTSPLVSKATNGAGHQFTLNRTGRWALSATCRWVAATSGETYNSLVIGSTIITADGGGTDGRITTRSLSSTRRFASGSVITVGGYQATGGSLNTGPETNGGWVNFTAVWLGP